MAETEALLRSEAEWDGCRIRTIFYDQDASFNVPTLNGLITAEVGPVILIQKVKGASRDHLERLVSRITCVYCIDVACAEDIYAACEMARLQHEDGEPRIPVREALAYLIVRKLERLDRWGGTALNKSYLWSEDLPKGGFPKDLLDKREILNIAESLVNLGVLTFKTSSGQRKYALAGKALVQPILDSKSFASHPRYRDLRAFFERKPERVTVRVLDYND